MADSMLAVRDNHDHDGNYVFVTATWHSVAWLVTANLVGVLLATLLLFPGLNQWLQPWTYGRWMPVHINLQLYGWCSLPLVAYLMKVYQVDRQPAAQWGRAAFWAWSAALTVGALSWLTGHSSGKLFLDWSGFARVVFPLAIFFLWVVMAWSLRCHWRTPENFKRWVRVIKLGGLALLLMVPMVLYWSADPAIYPPVNPDTGGPTGISQLESTLVVVAILLVLPFGLSHKKAAGRRWLWLALSVFSAESIYCLAMGRASASHHHAAQYLSLATVLVWVPLVPAFYAQFEWPQYTRRWRLTWLCWWAVLVPTGWCLFLPGLLDHFKYTDGLVGHALMAMAGFVTNLLIFVLIVLLGEDGDVFGAGWPFVLWQASTAGYIAIMFIAGWIEGDHPIFNMVPGTGRNVIYSVRLVLGSLMALASLQWFWRASSITWDKRSTVNQHFRARVASELTGTKAV